MFTKRTYHDYFREIYTKEKTMIIYLRDVLDKITDDHMSKALSWHMRREVRHAVLVKKLIRSLTSDDNIGKSAKAGLEDDLPASGVRMVVREGGTNADPDRRR